MLSLTKLADAEYLVTQVAVGVEEYYLGAGEAPGVWHGGWATELGLEGIVDHDHLRALLDGRHPTASEDLVSGNRGREVKAFDATFSAPKAVSLLWAFGTPEVTAAVSIAHTEAVVAALDVLERQAATARQQVAGVRKSVHTHGLAVAMFVHRTSREGDPQLHTHCVIPNLVLRSDGSCVALDGAPLYQWKRAVGCIYQEELRTRLTQRLGVEWTADRNGTREIVGFTPQQLRVFSKRTVAIEEHLASWAIDHADRAAVMKADEAASVATRPKKDLGLTPEVLRETWEAEADKVGLSRGEELAAAICHRDVSEQRITDEIVVEHLLDPDVGLCARRARFGRAHVVEAIASFGGGRLDAETVLNMARDFLASEHVVRLVGREIETGRRTPPRWSTEVHLAMERHVLDRLHRLAAMTVVGVDEGNVDAGIDAEGRLGGDQAAAVRALCAPGPSLRALIAPAGYGKTTALHAAAAAQLAGGHPVLGLATTNQAAAELRDVGLSAMTLARLRLELGSTTLAPNTVLVLDEVSQVATADAAWLLDAIAHVPDVQLWCVGDARQGRAVRAGGLAAEIERMAEHGTVPVATLTENRRQVDAAERDALTLYRDGAVAESQAVRTEQGWEHDCGSPAATRQAMAEAVATDLDKLGVDNAVALVVSHGDAEDVADRVRAIRRTWGDLGDDVLWGPAWGTGERHYATGDQVLVHATLRVPGHRLHNGSVLTVSEVTGHGLVVSDKAGHEFVVPRDFVEGRRKDGSPNLSHAWARTVDGAEGGTWEQVHLLGTAALDRYTGYVGQSRGQQATHTWNVSRLSELDHGGVLASVREPAEDVLAALEREPEITFASHDDPYELDRVLCEEHAAHVAIIATCPPAVMDQLIGAGRVWDEADKQLGFATRGYQRAEDELSAINPLARLRRDGRLRHTRAEQSLASADERLTKAKHEVDVRRAEVARLEQAWEAHTAWTAQHGWRRERVAEIDNELAHHWNDVVLGAVGEGDPLAFGVDRLRQARQTSLADWRAVESSLPPDRSDALARAEADLRHRSVGVLHAEQEAVKAEQRVDQAQERHWGRRDKEAIAAANTGLSRALLGVNDARLAQADAAARAEGEKEAQARREEELERTAEERNALQRDARVLGHALDDTRAARVLAAAAAADGEHEGHVLWSALGPAPEDPVGRAVWCGIATEVETWRDRQGLSDRSAEVRSGGLDAVLGPRPERDTREWNRVAGLVTDTPALVHAARASMPGNGHAVDEPEGWREVLTGAVADLEVARRVLVAERYRGRGMGLGIER